MSRPRAITLQLSLALLPYVVGAPLLTRMLDRSGLFGALFIVPLAVATRLKGRRVGLWAAVLGAALNALIWLTIGSGSETLRASPLSAGIGFLLECAAFAGIVMGLDALAVNAERKYRSLIEAAPQGITVVTDGRIAFLNRRLASVAGYEESELLGVEISRLIHEEDAAAALDSYQRRLASNEPLPPATLRFIHKRGDPRWVEVSGHRIDWNGRASVMYVVSDVTERKELEAQLTQSHKMEAIGRLASGVAHDFGNILQVILGYSSLMRAHLRDPQELARDITRVEEAAGRATSLTQQLLTFARRREVQARTVDLTELVQRAEAMLDRILGEDIRLTVSVCEEPCWVAVDPGQIEQVLLNLAVNARDAMPGGGALSIGVLGPGPEVELRVADTGYGMDEKTLSRLFEPFFTTKAAGKGTGLGLSIVYGIVKHNGGRISVSSVPGAGTRFTVIFPRAAAPAANASPPTVEPGAPGSGSVLVVEDDAAVRRLVRKLLESGGYRVTEAENGARALEALRQSAAGFDLLLTDVVMPGLSGSEVASEVRRTHPRTRIMYMTGHADGEAARRCEGGPIMRKPFSTAQLLASVRQAMTGAA